MIIIIFPEKLLPKNGVRSLQVDLVKGQGEVGGAVFTDFNVSKVANVSVLVGGCAVGTVEGVVVSSKRITALLDDDDDDDDEKLSFVSPALLYHLHNHAACSIPLLRSPYW